MIALMHITVECATKRISKISQYLMKLWTYICCGLFSDTMHSRRRRSLKRYCNVMRQLQSRLAKWTQCSYDRLTGISSRGSAVRWRARHHAPTLIHHRRRECQDDRRRLCSHFEASITLSLLHTCITDQLIFVRHTKMAQLLLTVMGEASIANNSSRDSQLQCRELVLRGSTPWVKKTRHQTRVNIFEIYWPIFTVLLPARPVGNLQQNGNYKSLITF